MADKEKIFDTLYDLKNRKKSPAAIFFESFIKVDAKTLRNYLWNNKIVPALKDWVLSSISMAFYKNGETYRKGSSKDSDYYDYTRHSKYSYVSEKAEEKGKRNDDIPDYRKLPAIPPDKAEEIIENVKEALKTHEYVTVDQFYTLFGYTSTDPNDCKWGWDKERFKGISTQDAPRGFVYLNVPNAIPINLR